MEDIDSINQKAYASLVDKFENVEHRPFYVKTMNLVEKYSLLMHGKTVLDIGSGSGAFALLLKNKGLDVTCLDPSESMVARCREKELRTIHSRFQDYSSQNKFSLVLALSSLLHVKKSEFPGQIRKIAAMQESGGYFVLSMAQGNQEGIVERGTVSERFFAMYSKDEILAVTSGQYRLIDYNDDYVSSSNRRFMLFGFQKI